MATIQSISNLIKSIDNQFIANVCNNQMFYMNENIENLINIYNNNSDSRIDIVDMVSLCNELLFSYLIKNNKELCNTIHSFTQAYNFVMLTNITSFWILYKFITNDNWISMDVMETYMPYTSNEIKKKELDILKTIDYNIYPFFMKLNIVIDE